MLPALMQLESPGKRVLLDDHNMKWLTDGPWNFACINHSDHAMPPPSVVRAYTPHYPSHAPYYVLHPRWRVGDLTSHKRKREQ